MLTPTTRPEPGGPDPANILDAYELERRVLVATRRMIRAVDLYSRRLVAQHQITGPQLLCLSQLAETNGMTATDLAGQVHLSPSTVVRILDRLEARNLIQRTRSTGDRRRVIVTVTAAGRQFSLLTPYSDRHPLRQAMQHLAATDRSRLATLLETLVEIMAAPPLSAVPGPPLDTLLTDTAATVDPGLTADSGSSEP